MTEAIRILLVEDNKVDQMAFKRFVQREKLPYDYVITGSVNEAEDILAAKRFDVLVIDYLLGDGTAFDLFSQAGDVPVVVITGNGSEEIAVKAMKAGATDYLIKDQEGNYLTVLPVTIENAIRFRQAETELKRHQQRLEELVEERTLELTRVNQKLVAEIAERNQAQKALQKARDELEMRVEERTAELAKANESLRIEIAKRKQAEEALRKSERFYRRILDYVPSVIYAKDLQGNYTMINKQFENLSGLTASKVLGRTDLELFPESGELTTINDKRVIKNLLPMELEEFGPVHGEMHIFSSLKSPLINQNGEVHGICGISLDITERKQAEQALRESEIRYKELFDNMNNGVAIYEVIDDGKDFVFKDFNKAAERIDKEKREDIIGKSVFEARPGAEKFGIINVFREVWKTDEPAYHPVSFYKDHKLVGWYENFIYKLPTGEIVAIFDNITERKKAEEALQARTHELTLLNSAARSFVSSLELDQVLATVLDQVRRIIGILTCSIWLADPKSGGLVCREATPPQDDIVRGWQLEMGQGLAGWTVQHGKILNIPDTQTEKRHFKEVDQRTGLKLRSVLSVPLKIRNEAFGTLQLLDETENRFGKSDERLAESLAALAAIAIKNARLHRQAQKDAETKTVLLQEVNHRVKNNLMAITGMLYIEQRFAEKSPERSMDAAMLKDMVNRIKGLSTVHNLLSASEWSPQSLSELARHLIASALQALPLDRRVTVNILTDAPAVVSPKEAHHLAIVINELSVNVVKYVSPVKETAQITVRINSDPDKKTVLIEFRDNGPGFPDMVLNSEGRNVGMYLLENTVRHSLRGEITFHNDNGAVVTIRFVKEKEW